MNPLKQKIVEYIIRQKTNKKTWFFVVLALVIVIIFITRQSSEESFSTVRVEPRDLRQQVVLSGRVQSSRSTTLGFADQGRIGSVSVREGDRVSAGQVLASLETADLEAELRNARASLAIARSQATTNTVNLEKITKEQDLLVENAYRNLLSSGLQAVPEDTSVIVPAPTISGTYRGPEGKYFLRIYASSAPSGASFELTGIEDRLVGEVTTASSVAMGNNGLFIQFSPNVSYVNTKWVIDIPNTRSSSYLTNLNAYNQAKTTRDRVIADARSLLDQNQGESSIAQARIEQAQATVESILARIAKRKIVAPFSGIIATNTLRVGQSTSTSSLGTSSSGSTITLINDNGYEIVLRTPERSVALLEIGQSTQIRLDALQDTVFDGVITSINPAETIVDGVPVYETTVVFTDADNRIRSGMTALVTILIQEKQNVLAVPASALSAQNTVSVVTAEGMFEDRVVKTGMRSSDGLVEIIEGLAENETIRILVKE